MRFPNEVMQAYFEYRLKNPAVKDGFLACGLIATRHGKGQPYHGMGFADMGFAERPRSP